MRAPAIIAFAKDWHEDPTSNHHVLRELAKSRRVLWLNSVGTRTPKLSSGRDLGKIRRKLGEFARGPVNVENDLWVFSPFAIPMHHSGAVRRVNRAILRATIGVLRRRLGLDEFHLWTFLPNVADYVGALGESLAVYYCVDEWSMFSYLDREETVAAERALLAKVDCVFAINAELAERKRAQNPATHLAPHGVDHALFARAMDDATVVPADIAALPRPVLGFYGTLRDWVDLDLIAQVARARPSWSIALLGQQLDDVSLVAGLPNVHLLGRKAHAELPAYCKGMDVGLIPYRIDERMKFVNPIKLREYLSAGLAVVSTPVPEVRRYERFCSIADGAPAFIDAVERALATDSLERKKERSAAMLAETWPMRVAAVLRIVDDAAASHRVDAKRLAAFPRSEKAQLVVTGASGALGSAVVMRLVAEGKKVRVFVRRFPEQPIPGVEYRFGDLGDPDAVDELIAGAETVIHVGATMKGDWSEHLAGTVVGTQNVIDACKRHHVRQLVHISSMSVIDWAGSSGTPFVSEAAALEPRADERGAYTRAKLEAERKVSAAAKEGLPCVILRPGQIFGGGIPLVNGAVARRAGARWLVLGDGDLELPLVYIDDVVDAVMASTEKGLTRGEVIQIIDSAALTQSQVLALAGGSAPILKVPRQVVFALGKLSELSLGALGRPSPIALYRLQSAMARLHYQSDRAAQLLGWQPRVGVREGIRRVTEAGVV